MVELRADRSRIWSYALFWTVGALALALLGGATGQHGESDWSAFPMTLGIFVTPGLLHAVYCAGFPARVTYRCDGKTLDALRGDQVVNSVACSSVREIRWESGSYEWVSFRWRRARMPSLMVEHGDDRARNEEWFPTILVWGHAPKEDFLVDVRSAGAIRASAFDV